MPWASPVTVLNIIIALRINAQINQMSSMIFNQNMHYFGVIFLVWFNQRIIKI